MAQIYNIDDLATEIVTTSNNIVNTSNQLLNRITDLYTKDITFQENVTVKGLIEVRQDLSNDDDFFPEYRYPPRQLTSISDEISGQAYGNGLYEVSSSAGYGYLGNANTIYQAFYGAFHTDTAKYRYSDGFINTQKFFIVPGYFGEWIKLKLPIAINLTKYGFEQRSTWPQRAPGEYKIYGSNDDVNWTVLVHKSTTITYTDYLFEESIATFGSYKYLALVVNRIAGRVPGSTVIETFNFYNFAIYGKESNKKFSVSDGSGYFAGDLQVGGDLTTTGTINGISKTMLSAKFGVTQVSCSKYQTFFLTNNGYVFACGENTDGQLGDGTTNDRTIPVQVLTGEQRHPSGYLSNIIQVSSGYHGTLFLTNTGNVFSCGKNVYGNLGINITDSNYISTTPVQVLTGEQSHPSGYLSDIVQISCNIWHSSFLTKDGTVYAIGRNGFGQLGTNNPNNGFVPVQVHTGEQFHPSGYLSDIVQVTTGSYVSLFLTKDGTVFGCGRNQYGELGNGDSGLSIYVPVQVLTGEQSNPSLYLSDIVEISCIGTHSLFLTNDGIVFGCGRNEYGYLGNGTTDTTKTPTQVKIDESTFLTNIVKLSTSGAQSMFITTNGAVFACGYDSDGRLGTNTGGNNVFATQVLTGEQGDSSTYLQNIRDISTGTSHTVYLSNDAISIVYGTGVNDNGQLATIDAVAKNRPVPHVINLNRVLTNYNSGKLITTGDIQIDGNLKTTTRKTNFSEERMYPPVRDFTSANHTVSGQVYGNGLYQTSETTIYGSLGGYTAFNETETAGYHSQPGKYVNGVYTHDNYIVNDYKGEWIKIKLPVAIKLTKYGFRARGSSTLNRAPKHYRIYGSNDNTSWIQLVDKSTNVTYTDLNYEESITTINTYNYFALVVNKLYQTDAAANCINLDEWYLYGQEILTINNYDTISLNHLDGSGYFTGKLETDGNITIRNTSPVINFRDTNQIGGRIWVSNNIMYFQSTDVDSITPQKPDGRTRWPLELALSNGKSYFDNDMSVNGRVTATNVPTSFTGSHICKSNTIDLYNDKYIGHIVSSSKKYSSLNSTYHKDNIKQNINKERNDCLPYVELTSKENDKNAFGIIYKIENETDTERSQNNGGFITADTKESYDRRLVISGCGEGFLWVSDYNGQIEAGDLISSSPIPGIGMKQDDDLLRSYTVAKITMDCDFNPALVPVRVLQSSNIDVEYTTTSNIVNTSNYETEYTITSNISITSNIDVEYVLTSNINDVTTNSNYDIEYTMTSNVQLVTSNYDIECVITSNIEVEYTTTMEIINTSNIKIYPKDENGEYIYVNQLDNDGNVIYDYEYEMKYVRLDGTITDENEYINGSNVYRMALVGGCYKCS